MTRTRRTLAWLAALATLGLVFSAYLHPDLVMTLATQLWICF